MNIRFWAIGAFALLSTWGTIGSTTGAAAGASSVSSLQQTVAAQGKLINQLQIRISALEKAVSVHPTYTAVNRTSMHKMTIPVRHAIKIADLGPSLGTLVSHHTAFLKVVAGWPHIYPLPSAPPTLAQLAAQEAQVAAQEAQLAQEISSLQNELGFDENYLYSQLTTVRNNTNNLGNQEMSDFNLLQGWLAGCTGGLGMSWGNWKYYIGNNRADNSFICSGNP